MKSLNKIILSTLMTAAATGALAQEKPDTYVDADMKTRLFALDEEWQGNTATFTRALSDDTLGILCDWKIKGSIDPHNNRISAKVEHLQCSATKITPQSWIGGRLLPDEYFSPSIHRVIPLMGNPIVVEQRVTNTNQLGVTSTYSRAWNFAKNEVCVRLYEGQFVDSKLNVYVDMDGGCHRMPQSRHTEKMRKELNSKWSHLQAR